MIQRKIAGPQEHFERRGEQSFRDIRPFTVRLSEALRSSASGLVLAMGAVGLWFEPAVVDLAVPAALAYAAWVLTRHVTLPMRLPVSAGIPDHSSPEPGSRKPKRAGGTLFLGWSITGQELWITAEDARQHMTIPGTTGAGKTTAILSLLATSLAQGSGFVLVDGKADRQLFGKVLALARRFGRDDDVRVLNFMVASGSKDSNTFNPFSIGNADAIRELLASQLGDKNPNDPNGLFLGRAVALLGTIAPVLVWLRDRKGVTLNIDVIRAAIDLRWIWKLAIHKIVILRDPATGKETEIDVSSEIAEEVVWPLKAYLGELPGWDPSLPIDKQKSEKPSEQHGYAQFYFTETFAQLAVSLGHIFKVEVGEIDMRDVVLNRRILVVNLPALENSDATLAALGKLVVASLRGMMAQLLGASLEGEYSSSDKPGMGPSPFPIVLDELAYYATSGLDRMLAMGRGLNICFMLGFQEVSGIWARIGEKTASLLGNANLTIAMRQQDPGRTREWIEKTAGQTYVTQATAYHGGSDGAYREARQAEVRPISRVDWQDLTSLLEGEAIVLFGGRRIYARVFHAEFDDAGPKRIGRGLLLAAPDAEAVRARADRIAMAAARIAGGALEASAADITPPAVETLVRAFAAAASKEGSVQAGVEAALAAVAAMPPEHLPPRPEAGREPVTIFGPVFECVGRSAFTAPTAPATPSEPVDMRLIHAFEEIERAGGRQADLRSAARDLLGIRDEALRTITALDPPAVSHHAFVARLDVLIATIEAAAGRPQLATAA